MATMEMTNGLQHFLMCPMELIEIIIHINISTESFT